MQGQEQSGDLNDADQFSAEASPQRTLHPWPRSPRRDEAVARQARRQHPGPRLVVAPCENRQKKYQQRIDFNVETGAKGAFLVQPACDPAVNTIERRSEQSKRDRQQQRAIRMRFANHTPDECDEDGASGRDEIGGAESFIWVVLTNAWEGDRENDAEYCCSFDEVAGIRGGKHRVGLY